MKFTRVRLDDFKCYAEAELDLEDGVTVVHGLNGSGKSSLLEACFFALYGARALDRTLDEVVAIGADDATVELWFTHGGASYRVERRVRVAGDRAETATALLETPEGTYEGARDVRRKVADLLRMDHEAFVNCAYVRQGEVNKLIEASPSDRRDMLDDLLQLGKLEDYRERASDARVGVGRVRDDKRGALSQVREQIEAKEERDLHERLNELRSEIGELDREIERIADQRERAVQTREEAAAVLEEYEERREELAAVEEDLASLRDAIESTERERESLREAIAEDREELQRDRSTLEDLLGDTDLAASLSVPRVEGTDPSTLADVDRGPLEERIAELEAEDDAIREAIQEVSVRAQEHAGRAESLAERVADLEERAEAKRDEADELAEEVASQRADLEGRRERLAEIDERIDALGDRFEDAPVDRNGVETYRGQLASDLESARERVTELETTIEARRETLAEAERLRERGKCPECGQDVDGAPHVESIEADRERVAELEDELAAATGRRDALAARLEVAEELVEAAAERDRLTDKRETIAELIDERRSTLEERAETVDELREEAAELEETAAEKRSEAESAREAADECREEVASHDADREAIAERLDRLERVADVLDRIEERASAIATRRDERETKAEVLEERRERLADKRERKDELAEAVDESRVEEAREERRRAAEYVEKADEKLAELEERRSDRQSEAGAVENEIEELESLRDRRDALAATVDRLESLYGEVEDLQRLYGELRTELRRRNVDALERMVNETFDLVYGNDSYAGIELDEDYELTVYQKDGEPLDPRQLSGGERALFNLSLRCGIYRLLAEGIEGGAPTPPLILDEPTVFLDSGHVTRLLELIEYMRDDVGVEQILVVSHDEELVGAADALVRVRKDPTTNRSSVERVDAVDAAEVVGGSAPGD